MRLELIETVMNARWSFYIRQPVGRVSTALGGEAQKAGDAYNAMTQMFSQSVQAMFYLIIAAIASRSEEHTSELQSLMRISYAVFCLKKKKKQKTKEHTNKNNNAN